jgi:hypothetical protein
MIFLKRILNEISSNASYEILSGVFSDTPEYVFDDFVMSKNGFFQKELEKILRKNPNADEDDVAYEFSDWIRLSWKEQVLNLNASDFTKENQKTMMQRKFGNANPNDVPNDEERTEYQRKLAKKLKPGTNESVIVLKLGNKFRLLEGWHRTMAILSLGNNGDNDPVKWNKIKIKAWVASGSSVKSVW